MRKNYFHVCGIGVDVVEIGPFKKLLSFSNFRSWKTYYYPQELNYCFSKTKPELHLAVRFAAKEAVIKAFAQFGVLVRFDQVEIICNPWPQVVISTSGLAHYQTTITLSHTSQTAVAFVIVSQ